MRQGLLLREGMQGDSVAYQKLAMPPSVTETVVPAEYGTRTYTYFQDGGEIEVVEGMPSEFIELTVQEVGTYKFIHEDGFVIPEDKACFYEAIRDRLIETEYLDESELESKEAFQLAVVKYQVEHNLPLGVIDQHFIELLDVKFGY